MIKKVSKAKIDDVKKLDLSKSDVISLKKPAQKKVSKLDDKEMSKSEKLDMSSLKLKQTSSSSGCIERQIATLKGLGLGKIGKTSNVQDSSSIRGMLKKVMHLIKIIK